MSKILLVGIDAHSKNNTACFIDHEGNILVKSFSFPNNLSGATELEQKIVNVMQKGSFTSLKVATEFASLYDIHLLDFLVASENLVLFSLKSISLILKSPVDLRKFIQMSIN